MLPVACFANVHSLRTRLAHAATSRSVLTAETASASLLAEMLIDQPAVLRSGRYAIV